MNDPGVIKLNPYILEQLNYFQLPINTIDDVTGTKSNNIVIFSDYGPENAEYETYGYYITTIENAKNLSIQLQGIKKKFSIPNLIIDYKNRSQIRKSPVKRQAFLDWFEKIKNSPGLIQIIAFDKRFDKDISFKKEQDEFKQEVLKFGLNSNPKEAYIYERMAKTMSIIPIITPYLQEKNTLCIVSDRDKILDTLERQELYHNSVSSTFFEVTKLKNFGGIHISTPTLKGTGSEEINKSIEEMLSIPDIAASSFGACLTVNKQQRLVCPDEQAQEMLEELCKIPPLTHKNEAIASRCYLSVALFDFEKLNDNDESPHYHLKPCQTLYVNPS